MATIQYKTFGEILVDMIDRMSTQGSNITDFSIGSPTRTLLEAFADELDKNWYGLRRLDRAAFVETAIAAGLDSHAPTFGLERMADTGSVVTLQFIRTPNGPLVVPAGSLASTNTGLIFSTVAEGTFGAGVGTVNIQASCLSAGTETNVPANTITVLLSVPMGVTGVTNPAPAAGGTGDESDEQLRARIIAIWGVLALGVKESYESWARAADSDVTKATAVGQLTASNSVTVFICGPSGTASAPLIATVQAYLDHRRPLTADVTAQTATFVNVDVTATIYSDGSKAAGALENEVEAALTTFLGWRMWVMGVDVTMADLIATMASVDGVQDVVMSVPSSNIVLGDGELPNPNTINLTVEE
ncbi:MAG: baseplate J/gp47 family protein [Candidatus Eisenbacteria sp.]|nr:baseplate J/gp47 family protein [Candidatus Eisenbacteria bacterium]